MTSGQRLRLRVVAVAAMACSCGSNSGVAVTGALVEIGDWGVDTAELISYRGKLPASLQPAGTDEEIIRSLLSSLVDRRIMILEGEALGYHREPEFLDRQHRLLSTRLNEMLSQRVLGPNVQVTDAEVEEMYRTYHWDRKVLPAHILSATEQDAFEVIRLLDQGADFTEVAREHSIAVDADRGGFLGQYFGPNDAAGEFVEAAHGLPIGEFTRTPVRTRDGYEVVKILDASPVSLQEVQVQLYRGIYTGKFVRERRDFVVSLLAKFGVVFHSDGTDALVRAAKDGEEVGGEAASLPVITFGDDHVLTVADVQLFVVRNKRLGSSPDSALVIDALRTRVLSDSLLVLEAEVTGLDTTAEFIEYRTRLYRRMIVTFVRKRKVLETINISEEDVRQEYEKGKDGFKKADQLNAREILLETRAEADAVVQRLRQGEDAVVLARSLSLRPGAVRSEGHVHVGASDGELWGEHFDAVWNAAEGDVVGPLQMQDGYLVLKIEAVEKDRLRTYDEMRLGLTHRLKLGRQYRAFEVYIEGLRERFTDRVVWHDDSIEALAERPPWSEAAQ